MDVAGQRNTGSSSLREKRCDADANGMLEAAADVTQRSFTANFFLYVKIHSKIMITI